MCVFCVLVCVRVCVFSVVCVSVCLCIHAGSAVSTETFVVFLTLKGKSMTAFGDLTMT